MPTASRKEREKLRNAQKAIEDALYAELLAKAPEHIKKRLNQPQSEFAKTLVGNLSFKGTAHNRLGAKYDGDTGQLLMRTDPTERGANYYRHDTMMDEITSLRQEYHKEWGKRGMAKVVAGKAGLKVRTIQKIFQGAWIKAHGQNCPPESSGINPLHHKRRSIACQSKIGRRILKSCQTQHYWT